MTVDHLIRTTMVAGVAAGLLALATQARADPGDTSIEARFGRSVAASPEPQAAAQATPQASPTVPRAIARDRALAAINGTVTTGSLPTDPAPSRTGQALSDGGRSGAYRELIARYAAVHGVPFGLADAMVRVESRYQPGARNGPNVGLTQINPRTARGLGFQGSAAALFEPATNLNYGIKYLAQAYRLAGGDTCGTVLRYQAGHGARSMTGAARVYCSKVKTILASR
jgi:soluble lytic murein transglycosylase-like protein